ncbi:hypothetical protein Q3G72_011191 [Acer saccharum]|nr:hypothetical protein Q3G72_011191 [Acer saccharum]
MPSIIIEERRRRKRLPPPAAASVLVEEQGIIVPIPTPYKDVLVGLRRARKGSSSMATTENVEDDESKEAGSESEGESLNGFIVNSTDVEDDDESSDAQDESDDNEDFGEILSRIKRSKGQNLSWEFEADKLAAFGKDPELCMKASNSGATTSPGNVFTPFGGGPRLCPGYELGRVELSVFLHHLITRFSWVPAEEDMLVLTTFILRSSDNIFIVILVQDQRNKGAGVDNKFASCIGWDIFLESVG